MEASERVGKLLVCERVQLLGVAAGGMNGRPFRRLVRSGGLAILVASEARGVDVTTCGQVVPAGDTGVLVADLSCAGDGTYLADVGVRLEAGARLDLAGHRLEMATTVTLWSA